MTISEIKDKNIWEGFLSGCKDKTFLQSWDWGEFNQMMGNKIWRLGTYEREELIGTALVAKLIAKRGTFLLIQHGPNAKVSGDRSKALEALLNELRRIGDSEKAIFIRMNPLWESNQENQIILKNFGFKEAPMHANAYEATLKLDIALPEEELLKNMRKTTRYLIHQTEKNRDISIEKSEKIDDLKIYQELNIEVAKRQKFVPFPSEYLKNEFEIFLKNKETVLILGRYQGKVASAALVIFWSGIGFYHQAASDSEYAKLSIPYLIQWEAIKEARRRGCVLYDFWGYVNPEKNPRHPWSGPTLFKMGFGGKVYEYVRAQDLPFSKKYWFTFFFEKLRKTRRGL